MAWIAATAAASDTHARYCKRDQGQSAGLDPIRLTVWLLLAVLLVVVWTGVGWTAIALI